MSDAFVAGIDPGDGLFHRGRVLFWSCLAASGICWFFLASRFVLFERPGPLHLIMGVAAAFQAAIPFVMRLTGSYRLAAHLMVGGLLLLMAADATLSGGIGAPATFGLMVLPVMATFFLGRRASIAYTAAILVVTVVLTALTTAGRVLPVPLSPELNGVALGLAVGGMVAFIAVALAVYDTEQELDRVRNAALVAHLADGVAAVGFDGRVIKNRALLELLELEPGDDLPTGLARVVAAATEGVQRAEVQLPHGRVGQVVASPLRVEGPMGTLDGGAVAIVRDVTLERDVDRLKNDLISTVSHELRTPMTSVLGFAKVTRSRLESHVFPHVPEDDARAQRALRQARENLDIVVAEGERLTSLINDLLDIAKMEAGHMEWHKDDLDADAVLGVVTQALDATRGLFTDTDVALRDDLHPPLVGLHADRDRIVQVLINLISNAAKFTERGSVTVRARGRQGRLVVEVIDTGAGIADTDLERIFHRFSQSGGHAKGTGLGLPICREIVTAHGGTIDVRSEAGAGSTFTVTLPGRPG